MPAEVQAPSITIEPATIDDAPAISRTQVQAWHDAYRDLLPAGYLQTMTADGAAYRWAGILRDDRQHVLLARCDETIAGFANAGPARDWNDVAGQVGEIYAIYLLAEYWGRGIGRQLCTHALDTLVKSGFTEVLLWVLENNKRGRRFYEQAGFIADGAVREVPQIAPDIRIMRYRRALPDGPAGMAPPPS